MTRPRQSTALATAQRRINALKYLHPDLDLGNGLSLEQFTAIAEQLDTQLTDYNATLTALDAQRLGIETLEDQVRKLSERMLNAIASLHGRDSDEYEIAGGSKRVSRKSTGSLKAAIASPPASSGSSPSGETFRLIANTPSNAPENAPENAPIDAPINDASHDPGGCDPGSDCVKGGINSGIGFGIKNGNKPGTNHCANHHANHRTNHRTQYHAAPGTKHGSGAGGMLRATIPAIAPPSHRCMTNLKIGLSSQHIAPIK